MHISSHSFSRHPLKETENKKEHKIKETLLHLSSSPANKTVTQIWSGKTTTAEMKEACYQSGMVTPAWVEGVIWGALRGWDVWDSHDGIKVNEWDNTRKWQGSKHIWKRKGYAAARKVHIFRSKDRWRNRWRRRWFKRLLSAVHQEWCNFRHRALVEQPEDPNLPTSVS